MDELLLHFDVLLLVNEAFGFVHVGGLAFLLKDLLHRFIVVFGLVGFIDHLQNFIRILFAVGLERFENYEVFVHFGFWFKLKEQLHD